MCGRTAPLAAQYDAYCPKPSLCLKGQQLLSEDAADLAGLRVSAGAACSSGKVARSPVLQAMGFGEAAGCGIRISLPWNAPEDAAERFVVAWAAMRDRLSRRAA